MNPRIIIVTGANGGLGQAIARAFLDEASHNFVWLGVHTRRENAGQLASEFPQRCECVELDVRQPSAWQSVVAHIRVLPAISAWMF